MNIPKRLLAATAAIATLCLTLAVTVNAPSETPQIQGAVESAPITVPTAQGDEALTPVATNDADDAAVDAAPIADNDTDGVEDAIESLFGTDSEAEDTDGDGLSDYDEIYTLGTDATLADSDQNGIGDADEDTDGDSLTNREEQALATDMTKSDTDHDGIDDGDEQATNTDPLVYDTDDDGVFDGYELALGTDPATPEDTFTVTQSHENEDGTVAASVAVTLAGEQVSTLSLSPTDSTALFPATMPGYIDTAYDLTVDGTFENAALSFPVGKGTVEPTIYRFDATTQTLTAVETTVEGDTATATVSAPATYILLDRTVYEGSLVWEETWGISDLHTYQEIVFVIDDSESMAFTDPDDERLAAVNGLIDRLPANSRIGIVKFGDNATVLTPTLLTDKEAAKSLLTTEHFTADGATALYDGVHRATRLYRGDLQYTQRVMVVLSDGLPTDDAAANTAIEAVTRKEITTYAVSLGDEGAVAHSMNTYATAVNGTHYHVQATDELTITYDTIGKYVDLAADTDGDTIPDYYEDHMIAFNGVTVALDKTKSDTDGDGLADNEEVAVELIYSEDGTSVYVKGTLLSDPTLVDSDGDGQADDVDEVPYDNTFSGILTTGYATSNVSFAVDFGWFAGDNTVYNPGLSKFSSVVSSLAYAENILSLSNTAGNVIDATTNAELLTYFGMEQAVSYSLSEDYNDIHLSEVTLGYKNVNAGSERKTVLAVIVRGTNATIEEWSSNCDIGDLANDTADDDWINTDNHKGFDIAANRITRFVEQYIAEHNLREESLIYWVTGHSRGAGIANIIGANLEKAGRTAFTYTFAAPNSTLAADATSYTTIFNVVNSDDFVPCLPIATWGYTCYGKTTRVSIRDSYEKVWETHTGLSYNSDGNNMDKCVEAIGGIITSGWDPRIDCYRYTCACHGDGTNDTITITNTGMSESSREKAIAKIPQNALSCCIITRYDGGWLGGWNFDVCQSPGYFMQLLAAFMGGEIDAYRFAMELNIADRYENAKTALVAVGISGVEHPHYTETYYVLADNLTAANFS